MELIIAILAKVLQMLLPAILSNAQDVCEDGSDKDAEAFAEKVRSSGWSAEAIAATNPKE